MRPAVQRFAAAVAADGAAIVLALWLVPHLSRQFQDLGFINSVVMGLFFLVFCLAVYGIRKLRTVPLPAASRLPQALFEKQALGALGVIFALSLSIAIAYVTGFLDSVVAINRGLLDEPSVTIYLLLTPASWFGLALIYVLVLTSETEATVDPTAARYAAISFVSLLGVNLMGLAFAAVWQAVWARFSSVQAFLPMLLVNALLFLLFLLLLGPPRLLYLSRSRQLLPTLSFLLLVGTLVVLAAP